ncbi:MAG: hypothetical protein U0736_28080 [Gemmataceae bacterium]
MRRMLPIGVLALVLACQAGPDTRPPLTPLPDTGEAPTYKILLDRARNLAGTATDAFYADNWVRLEEVALRLEHTATFLPKAKDAPDKQKDALTTLGGDLVKLSRQLKDAATGKDVEKTNEVMKQINLKVRELRPGDGT